MTEEVVSTPSPEEAPQVAPEAPPQPAPEAPAEPEDSFWAEMAGFEEAPAAPSAPQETPAAAPEVAAPVPAEQPQAPQPQAPPPQAPVPLPEVQVPPAVPEAAQVPAAAPQAPPLAQPAVPALPEVPAVAPPATPPPTPPPAAGPTAEQVKASRTEWVGKLATRYGLSDEQADGMQTDPSAHIPQMMAEAHAGITEDVVHVILAQLPAIIRTQMHSATAESSAQDKFYTRWPQLKADQHLPTIRALAQVYRAANPQASVDEFVNNVGAQAVLALSLPFESPSQPAPPVPAAPGMPQALAPGALQPTPQAVQQAFQPASPGGGTGGAPAAPETNLFAELAEGIEREGYV